MSSVLIQPPSPGGTLREKTQAAGRDVAIDYLRSFVTVLVVFHHAALAYTSFSTFNAAQYTASTAPVVDPSRWALLDLPVSFNDTFFMPLMFLISGLFTLSSLDRKGSMRFFVERLQRLGLPFLIAAVSIMPLAYWPSRLLAEPQSPLPYWHAFFTSDTWPAGPAWFLWLLLAFSSVFAVINHFIPVMAARIRHRPTIFIFFLVTVLSYLPLRLIVPANAWTSLGGPFDVQTSRIGLYFAYFGLGAALGSSPEWQSMRWPKHWGYLLLLGVLSYMIHILIPQGGAFTGLSSRVSDMIIGTAFAVSCAATSLGLLGAFRQFVHKRRPLLDSLTSNAYGIYIIHYAFITWFQFLLLPVSWPAWMKFFIVFTLGLGMSWGATMLLRRIPAVRKFL